MKMQRWLIVALIALAAAAIGFLWLAATKEERMPDEFRIRSVIAAGERAVMERDLGSAMACISKNYHDSQGLTYQTLRQAAARALQAAEDYQISLDLLDIDCKDGRALAKARVNAVAQAGGFRSPAISFTLDIRLAKERARRWWIFPVTRWRVISLDGIPELELPG